jgi:hypothetical protein
MGAPVSPDPPTQAVGRMLTLEAWGREKFGGSVPSLNWRHVLNPQLLTFQCPYCPPLPLRAQPRLGGRGLRVYIVCLGEGDAGGCMSWGKGG